MIILNCRSRSVSGLDFNERSFNQYHYLLQGDNPRFVHLSSIETERSVNSKDDAQSGVSDADEKYIQNQNKVMQENKLKQELAERAKQNELAKQIQLENQHVADLMWEMHEEGDKEENAFFPRMISQFSSLIDKGLFVGPRF